MEITIQTDPLCTVIKKKFDAEYVKAELARGNPVAICYIQERETITGKSISDMRYAVVANPGQVKYYRKQKDIQVVVALPPIPKNPTPDDAELLYLYASHGLRVEGVDQKRDKYHRDLHDIIEFNIGSTIIHAIDSNGEKHSVAIEG